MATGVDTNMDCQSEKDESSSLLPVSVSRPNPRVSSRQNLPKKSSSSSLPMDQDHIPKEETAGVLARAKSNASALETSATFLPSASGDEEVSDTSCLADNSASCPLLQDIDVNGYLPLEDEDASNTPAQSKKGGRKNEAYLPLRNCNGVGAHPSGNSLRVQFEEDDDGEEEEQQCGRADTVVLQDGRVMCTTPSSTWFKSFPSPNGNVKFGIGEKSSGLPSPEWSPGARKSQRSRTESGTFSSSSSSDEESSFHLEIQPPDGGWGWVVVAASFMINLIADGVTFSFGVIYVEFLSYFGEGKGKTAWIGSLFMAIPLLSGPIASSLTDRYGCRRVTIVGALLATIGFILSAFTDSLELLCVTFGLISGFGLSLCCVTSVVIVAYYFEKRRSFATGLSVCGSGIGTFIFAPLIHMLLDEYGWRGTMVILAGCFLNMVVCGALMRDLEGSRRKRHRSIKSLRTATSSESFSVKSQPCLTSLDLEELKRVLQSGNVDELLQSPQGSDSRDLTNARLYSSLVSLPTFIKNGEVVPIEVLEVLSSNRSLYDIILQNYPSLLFPKSLSDQGQLYSYQEMRVPVGESRNKLQQVEANGKESAAASAGAENMDVNDPKSKICEKPTANKPSQDPETLWLKRPRQFSRKLSTAYLKDLKMHRHSLTYRGAMLNIRRYRLRASSCPDIYRNSITAISKDDDGFCCELLKDLKDILLDMVDISHFSNIKFMLFTVSNFLLYAWYDVPYMYLTDNAIQMGHKEDGSYLISIIGILNMIGEVILGYIGDKPWADASLVYGLCMGICGGITVLIPLLTSYGTLSFVCGGFGFFISANYALSSIILVEMISLERFTNAYGLLLLVQGIANLVGPPFAGWLFDITGSYSLSFYLAGLFIGLSGLMLLILPILKRWRSQSRMSGLTVSDSESESGNTNTVDSALQMNGGLMAKCNPPSDSVVANV